MLVNIVDSFVRKKLYLLYLLTLLYLLRLKPLVLTLLLSTSVVTLGQHSFPFSLFLAMYVCIYLFAIDHKNVIISTQIC